MITLENVTKIYSTRSGNNTVLNNISLTLNRGEKIGILGRNGSGKSTLIRLLSGAERPTSGRIHRGMKISWPLAFGGAFQGSLTGLDNLKFICRIYGVDYADKIAFVDDFSELGRYLREPVKTYSSGMRARLAFAISMAIEFDCFLIDEIIAVGDVRFHEKCQRELFERRADRALLLVSHDEGVIRTQCRRAGVLVKGHLTFFDNMDDAFAFYGQWGDISDPAAIEQMLQTEAVQRSRQALLPAPAAAPTIEPPRSLTAPPSLRQIPPPPKFRLRSPGQAMIYARVDAAADSNEMHRALKTLAGALARGGEAIRLITWDRQQVRLRLLTQDEVAAQETGGFLVDLAAYPTQTDEPLAVEAGDWLLLAEGADRISDGDGLIASIVAAQGLGLAVAVLVGDCRPLHCSNPMTAKQAGRAFQALLLADALLPLSPTIADDLFAFFAQDLGATAMPPFVVTALPGQIGLLPRPRRVRYAAPWLVSRLLPRSLPWYNPHARELTLLAQASPGDEAILEALVEAFSRFCRRVEGRNWRLVVTGAPSLVLVRRIESGHGLRIFLCKQTDESTLVSLYTNAALAFVAAADAEGGLPLARARWYAVPCLCPDAVAAVGILPVEGTGSEALLAALCRCAADPHLLSGLTAQMERQALVGWTDYIQSLKADLAAIRDPLTGFTGVYGWMDGPDGGDDEVGRETAQALRRLGVRVIPVELDSLSGKLVLAGGKRGDDGAGWIEPGSAEAPQWLLVMAPPPQDGLAAVLNAAADAGLRCAVLFHAPRFSTAPDPAAALADVARCDAVLAMSKDSLADLRRACLGSRQRSGDIEQRICVLPLPTELPGTSRQTSVRQKWRRTVRLLAVVNQETRPTLPLLLDAFTKASARAAKPIELILVEPQANGQIGQADGMTSQIGAIAGLRHYSGLDPLSLRRLYLDVDFSIFTAQGDVLARPVVESLWNGCPCLVDQAGPVGMLAAGGGCLPVDVSDVEALAGAIIELVGNDARRLELARAAVVRPVSSWTDYARGIVAALTAKRERTVPIPTVSPRSIQSRPLLTVAVTVDTADQWLAATLSTLCSNGVGPDSALEVLVVDVRDADAMPENIGPYLDRPNFLYLHPDRSGNRSVARRYATHLSVGRYLWCLEEGDLLAREAIAKLLQWLDAYGDLALVQLHAAERPEADPVAVLADPTGFVTSGLAGVPTTPDQFGCVTAIVGADLTLFTRSSGLVLRRDHAVRAYSRSYTGVIRHGLREASPSAYYVLQAMVKDLACWIGQPLMMMAPAPEAIALWTLEWLPEALDLAEYAGAAPERVDALRAMLVPNFVEHWTDLFQTNDPIRLRSFSPDRVLMRMKHSDAFAAIAPDLYDIYDEAQQKGHVSAVTPSFLLFAAFAMKGPL